MDINEVFSGTHGVVIAGLLGVVAFSLLFGFKQAESKVHKGAQALSRWMSQRGFSASVTAPLDDLATGDAVALVSDGLKEIQYLHDPANTAKEMASVCAATMADPVLGPKFKQFLTDLLGGATPDILAADATGFTTAVRAGAPVLPIQQHLDQVMHILDSIKGGHFTMADVANLFNGNPTTAPIAGYLTKIVAAGAAVAGTAAAGPAGGAIASALANSVTVPDGHVVTITKAA